MDTYLMMLYVSLDQERALKKLFTDNGWKYRKPDLQQLTDQIGPAVASKPVEIDVGNNDETERVASPVRTATRITSPVRPATGNTSPVRPATGNTSPVRPATGNTSPVRPAAGNTSPVRPATRSQNSKIRSPASDRSARSRRASKTSIKTLDSDAIVKTVVIKEEASDVVNEDDLTEYMDFGDEDDDFIDDDKVAKKRARTLSKTLGCDHMDTKQDIMSKLDGTQEDLDDTVMSNDDMENNTDDEGHESNTSGTVNLCQKSDQIQKRSLKVIDRARMTGRKVKSFNLDVHDIPMQYQCGMCKVKYSNKKELNKHLTDRACKDTSGNENAVTLNNDLHVDDNNETDNHDHLKEGSDTIAGVSVDEDKMDQTDDISIDKGEGIDDIEEKGIKQKNFYICDQCELAYKTPYNLKTHQILMHRMAFDESFECNICRFSYGTEHILELHKKDKHPVSEDLENTVECEECQEKCENLKTYTVHKKRNHHVIVCWEVNRCHMCEICGKGFTRQDSLKSHYDFIHLRTKRRKQKPRPTERKFVCSFCGKAFLRKNNLTEHIGVKHENTAKKHVCEECGETFLRPYSLEYHTNKVHLHEKPYQCDKCHKMYFSRINLRQHQEICFKEEEEKELCPYCEKRFCHKRNLSMHIEAIHSESPLTCECGVIVKWRSSIAKHRRRCVLHKAKEGSVNNQNRFQKVNRVMEIKREPPTETVETETARSDGANGDANNLISGAGMGFTTISTDGGIQVVSNEIAQALQDQGLLINGAVAGTLKLDDGKTTVDEDPSVQSVYYVIMKE